MRSQGATEMNFAHGRSRVVIEGITPQVDAGRHPVRRVRGDEVTVTAAIFADGHDLLAARVLFRHKSERRWRSSPMTAEGNDLWRGSFHLDRIGGWIFTVQGWIDRFESWAADLQKRLAAQGASGTNVDTREIPLALRTGAILVQEASLRTRGIDAKRLVEVAALLNRLAEQDRAFYDYPLDEDVHRLMTAYPDLHLATEYVPELPVWCDRELAAFSAWYELFPRSASPTPGAHGTFADVERQLPEIAGMGFDILYMPPIHPIGRAFRKGPNNTANAGLDAPGSPWAIGDREAACEDPSVTGGDRGGHKSIHPELGTFADFERLVASAKSHGMEIALDIAIQCSPDHPWLKEHPNWFVIRPDGSIQYAENPPKKYQDIYPLNFESPDWRRLWGELYSVFEFWIERGVRVFRVDNPHTKALPFWEWCLEKINSRYPDVIFLAEAFTRPHVMYALAKRGFTQSYTYFTWRNTRYELESYLKEITQPPVSDFFRPNFWPNTPDILHRALQQGHRPAFMQRLILAATLAANYGIYGPAYELGENVPAAPAAGRTESEEYMHSEKYQIRQRDRNAPGSLVPLIASVNRIRRENPALHSNASLHFHATDNPELLCYSKSTADRGNTILAVVNLDAFNDQSGWTDLDPGRLGIADEAGFEVEDLLTGARYAWRGRRNYVALRPSDLPAHIFRIARQA
jgi:starch synthase (maltosyl-transferring)